MAAWQSELDLPPQTGYLSNAQNSPQIDTGNYFDEELLRLTTTAHLDWHQLLNDQESSVSTDHIATEPRKSLQQFNFHDVNSPAVQTAHSASLPRRKSRYLRGPDQRSSPIHIPGMSAGSSADPMQRWRESPPEDEAASLAAITNALKNTSPRFGFPSSNRRASVNTGRAASTTSGTSVRTESTRSTASDRSSTSAEAYRKRTQSVQKRVPKLRRKYNDSYDQRPYPCTFCCDSFQTKYDWSRHEKTLHLGIEKWICAPYGGIVVSQVSNRSHCAYCSMLDPTPDHLNSHGHRLCQEGPELQAFSRKDHLVQHLRCFHHLDILPIIDDWKSETSRIVSRCGFCDASMETWQQRTDHLSKHFKEGKTMNEWRGDHGFEPSIAAQIRNAMPPYVLGAESVSFAPFSATSSQTKDHLSQMQVFYEERQNNHSEGIQGQSLTPAASTGLDTATKFLTLGLGRYAQRQMRLGNIPTDEMFQEEARRLIYGNADGWDQTVADNTEWLTQLRMHVFDETTDLPYS